VVELSVRAQYGIGVEVRLAVAEEVRKRYAQPDRPADSSWAMLERARTFGHQAGSGNIAPRSSLLVRRMKTETSGSASFDLNHPTIGHTGGMVAESDQLSAVLWSPRGHAFARLFILLPA
jgi:hypothetical protein